MSIKVNMKMEGQSPFSTYDKLDDLDHAFTLAMQLVSSYTEYVALSEEEEQAMWAAQSDIRLSRDDERDGLRELQPYYRHTLPVDRVVEILVVNPSGPEEGRQESPKAGVGDRGTQDQSPRLAIPRRRGHGAFSLISLRPPLHPQHTGSAEESRTQDLRGKTC